MTGKTAKGVTVDPKAPAAPQTPEQRATQAAATESLMQQTSLEQMVAQRKQLDEAIKAHKAAMPKQSKLEIEIAKQAADNGGAWVAVVLGHRVDRRVRAGQPLVEAVDAVLAQYRALLLPPTPEGN